MLVKVEAGWVCLVDAGRWSGLEDLSEVRDVVRFLGCTKRASWLQTAENYGVVVKTLSSEVVPGLASFRDGALFLKHLKQSTKEISCLSR